jgi:hypothetical protein
MVTRISNRPTVKVRIIAIDVSAYCVVNATVHRLEVTSKPLPIGDLRNVEATNRLARLQQTLIAYEVEDDSEIIHKCPAPVVDNDSRSSNPTLYCKQWDEYYRLRDGYAELKKKLFENRREQRRGLLVEIELLNDELCGLPDIRALVLSPIPMTSKEPTEERCFALYRDSLWAASRQLEPEHWGILIDKYLQQDDARFAVAIGTAQAAQAPAERERISAAVRRAVWVRDQGKCVSCGSRERLEYDHIIPVAQGGGNTERNIELLCEKCNRTKSDSIT